MPINLVQASFDQISKIPGAVVQDINVQNCNNPTFDANGGNKLAETAPQPKPCDKQDAGTQCPDGTGGMANVQTAVSGASPATTAPAATVPAQPAAGSGVTPPPAPGGVSVDGGTSTWAGSTGSGSTGSGATTSVNTGGARASATTSVAQPSAGVVTMPGGVASDGSTQANETTTTLLAGGPLADGGSAGGLVSQACDADTGACQPVVNVAQGGLSPIQIGDIAATTLPKSAGSGPPFVLILVVILLVLGLVLWPAFAWRHLSIGRPE